ncbi:bile acid:sodium symporter family protein [Pseudochelatococcus lubricantis]|uniref:bile acid:sodium symporter family protein n=1 Tax=Pseudochelatococcus lubricantis TaxID=1538102 RepID=UPI0035EF5C28
MTLAHLLLLTIKVSILFLVFTIGLSARREDAIYLVQHRALFLRSILAMNVIMVVVAAAIAALFHLPRPVSIALVALAVSPVPPILANKQRGAGGSATYTIGLLVAASLMAIVLAPLAVRLVGAAFGHDTGISALKIGFIELTSVIAPLAAGIAVRHYAPAFADRIARPVSAAAMALLVAACLPVLFVAWPAIWAMVGNGVAVALAAFTLIGLLVGHQLGGPEPKDRTVLALATGTRHPGIAMAIASVNFPDERAALAVVLYHLVIGTLVSIPYIKWRRRVAGATQEV